MVGGLHSNMGANYRQRNISLGNCVYFMEEQMADIHNVTQETFQNEVLDSPQPVLVDFSAEWCGPCKMLDPIVKQLAGEWENKIKVVKIDADENPDILMQFNVMGIPTLLFFVEGEVKDRVTGYQPKDKLVAKFTQHLA
jgi:thioredoxin 1